MQPLLALLAAIAGLAHPLPQNTPPSLKSLQQASQQAPRVPLDQIVPVQAPQTKPTRAAAQKPTKPIVKKTSKLSACRSFKATVYGPPWGGINGPGMTATGIKPIAGKYLIAVDPQVIALGSRVKIWPNPHGWRGDFLAADTGGAIRGSYIDIFVWQGPKAMDRWGVRQVQVCRD